MAIAGVKLQPEGAPKRCRHSAASVVLIGGVQQGGAHDLPQVFDVARLRDKR
jgi:hypothetical protein